MKTVWKEYASVPIISKTIYCWINFKDKKYIVISNAKIQNCLLLKYLITVRNKKLYLNVIGSGCLSRYGSINNSEFRIRRIEKNPVSEILLSIKIQDYGRFSDNGNLILLTSVRNIQEC
jgi:hypothetical protein